MARVLRLVPEVDYKKLPLNPVEGSVFLKIDGKLSDEEIARATGFHIETVQKALDRLVELGAAASIDKAKEQTERVVKAAAGLALGGNLGKGQGYDARVLQEEVDLALDKRKVILDAYARLDRLNFYELLGLHNLVDKKEVKAAYYAVAPDFHPDKFFKRSLGSYKAKIEAIFARLTLAHDTLSSKQRRAEYDEYLAQQEIGRRAAGLLESNEAAIREAQAQIEAEARRAADAETEAQTNRDVSDRKRALAAKLGARPGASRPAQAQAPAIPAMDARAAAEALRVRYEYAKEQALRGQLDTSLSKGRTAAAQGDWAGAANLFRIAATLAPSNPDVQREAEEMLNRAAVHLAETFAKLGEFELTQERWADAAANLLKACAGRPDDARLHERAGFATFKEGSNPKRAADLARRAVELSPRTPQYRITLAYAYAAGGLEQSARAEIDRALEIAPKNEAVVELVNTAKSVVAGLVGQVREKASEARPSAVGLFSAPPRAASVSPASPAPKQDAGSAPWTQPQPAVAAPPSPGSNPGAATQPAYAQPLSPPQAFASQAGPAPQQPYASQPGPSQPGPSQPGPSQPGPLQPGPSQPQPYAQQPGYGPQPGYAPQQPGYAPQQPGYGPQPGYAPQQPGYAPQQPGYAPQQPGYAAPQAYAPQPYAQQPGYAQPAHAPQASAHHGHANAQAYAAQPTCAGPSGYPQQAGQAPHAAPAVAWGSAPQPTGQPTAPPSTPGQPLAAQVPSPTFGARPASPTAPSQPPPAPTRPSGAYSVVTEPRNKK